ncbi:D-alanine--D-alanine ligase [Paenibacillus sp. N1-5-1-14]|uniref:D-alanine--D-alanine ligase n=1 Tax=Paenibacillus radicibacter TaxID=2972488 RepID=UPI0021594131|nr:D-alanine--D-alanine ligase [Paenibacillus radicibacter]MCR8643051.1 D-alanine--D-alanine ligase [Paenibacillus radicibacter]
MTTKTRVGLIYGGKSGEHEVSLQTAFAVSKALDYSKYEIIPFYITKQGEWNKGTPLLSAPQSATALAYEQSSSGRAMTAIFSGLQTEEKAQISGLPTVTSQQASGDALDVIFPLLHGTFGEDGTIQGLLEMANIPYVGAGVLASAVGMDKVFMKKAFAAEGLPQCVYRHFTRTQWEKSQHDLIMEMEISLGYPCFVKPANLGSSVGISKASNRDELVKAVAYALRFDRKVIVEENIDAREIEVAVLGNDEPQASVPGEIVSSSDYYDYKAKYVDGTSTMIIPAEIPAELAAELREMAIRAFQAVDCSGLSRVDFFVRKEDQAVMLNEINTMPGFTPFSMYPLLWKETGKPYTELLNDLIGLAIERHAAKQQIQYTMDE